MDNLDDPVYPTTTLDFDFKYVPRRQLDNVIEKVKKDRLKSSQDSVWNNFRDVNLSRIEDKFISIDNRLIECSNVKVISKKNVLQKPTSSSLLQKQTLRKSADDNAEPQVKKLTNEDLQNLVDKAYKEVIDKISYEYFPPLSSPINKKATMKIPNGEINDEKLKTNLGTLKMESKSTQINEAGKELETKNIEIHKNDYGVQIDVPAQPEPIHDKEESSKNHNLLNTSFSMVLVSSNESIGSGETDFETESENDDYEITDDLVLSSRELQQTQALLGNPSSNVSLKNVKFDQHLAGASKNIQPKLSKKRQLDDYGDEMILYKNDIEIISSPTPRSPINLNVRQQKNPNKAMNKLSDQSKLENKSISPILIGKMTHLQQKICNLLNEVLDKLTEDQTFYGDDPIVAMKRKKRLDEFNVRFSRNYIYQIERMIDSIKTSILDLENKVCNLYGLIQQALQFCASNITNFNIHSKPENIKKLINLIITATYISYDLKIFDPDDFLTKYIVAECKKIIISFDQKVAKNATINNSQSKAKHLFNHPNSQCKIFGRNLSTANSKLYMYDTLPNYSKRKLNMAKRMPVTKSRSVTSNIQKLPNNKSHESLLDKKKEKPVPCMESKQKETKISTQTKQNVRVVNSANTLISKYDNSELDAVTLASPKEIRETENISTKMDSTFAALQEFTQQQVRDILEPLMSNLGLFLSEKSPVNIQTILNNLETKKQTELVSLTSNPNNEPCSTSDNDSLLVNKSSPVAGVDVVEIAAAADDDSIVVVAAADYDAIDDDDVFGEPNNHNNCSQSQKNDDDKNVIIYAEEDQSNISMRNSETKISNQDKLLLSAGKAKELSKIKDSKEQKIRYTKNVQHLYVTSTSTIPGAVATSETLVEKVEKHGINHEEVNVKKSHNDTESKPLSEETRKNILQTRFRFLQKIAHNPFYVNEHFEKPWEIISGISDYLIDEMIEEVGDEIDFGASEFVEDFLHNELE